MKLILTICLGYLISVTPAFASNEGGETVTRVGFGGRDGYNRKIISTMPQSGYLSSTQTVVLEDPSSASGDSGGPIYANENGGYCLYSVHSTVTLERYPQLSYNPSIRGTLEALQSLMLE